MQITLLSPINIFNSLYYSLVHAHLMYVITVWASTYPSYLTKLQKLQNKAIKLIKKSSLQDKTTTLFRKLQILKVHDLFTYENAKIMRQFT